MSTGCHSVSMTAMPTSKRLRFGIPSLLLLTALAAVVLRLTHTSGVVELTFHDLQLDPTSPANDRTQTIPAAIERLDERQVRLRGYIYPSSVFRAKGIKRFILCRDNNEPPSATCDSDFVIVQMVGPAETDFTTRPVAVSGTFAILPNPPVVSRRKLFYEIAATKVERLD